MPDYLPLWLILAIIAPAIGSFIGVLVIRLPEGRAVVASRSVCEHCGHVLAPRDLIPLASWLWLRGKCRYCGGNIGMLYPAIELAALAIAVWAAAITSGGVLIASCILGWTLLAVAVIDWRSYLVPDVLSLFLLLTGFVAGFAFDPSHFPDHVIGAGAGVLFFAVLAWGYRAVRGREGLGFGDAKLLGGLGAWVAWQGLPSIIFFAAVLGLFAVLAKSFVGARLSTTDRIPFGTFLAAAGWLVWLYGPLGFA